MSQLHVLKLILAALLYSKTNGLLERPIDTLAVPGLDAQLNCTSIPPSDLSAWTFIKDGSSTIISYGYNPAFPEYRILGTPADGVYHLYMPNVTLSLEGTYQCSIAGSKAEAMLMVLDDGPVCAIENGNITIVDVNTDFNCTVNKGVPPGESVWTKDGTEVSRYNESEHVYTTSFNRYDNGAVFNCGIQHSTLSTEDEDLLMCDEPLLLEVQFPAIVAITRETNNTVIEGDDYFAECEVQEYGNPPEIDDWYWYLPNKTKLDNGILNLVNVGREANGTYTCVAENTYYDYSPGYGNATVDLNVHYKPEVTIHDISTGRVVEGKTYKATCEADANPAATFSWTGGPDNIELSNNYTLEIKDARRENEGIYTCHASNVFFNGKRGYGNSSVDIDIQHDPLVKAIIYGDASDTGQVIDGDDASIDCVVMEANPAEVTVSWQSQDVITEDNWLNFTSVLRSDHGEYICMGNNTFWDGSTGRGTFSVLVDVQYSPEIEMFDNVTHTIEGKMFKKECEVIGNPMPDVQWTYNGNLVSENATLKFEDIQRYQSGEYICKANNTFWNDQPAMDDESFYLNVQYPPAIDVAPRHICKEQESITLTCKATDANPMNTEYTWMSFEGQTTYGAELPLYNVTRYETGNYTCIGKNTYDSGEHGTGSNTTYFDVQYGPDVVVEESNVWVREGTMMTLKCLVDSNPPVNYHNWTKDYVIISSTLSYTLETVNRSDAGVYNCTAETTFYNDDVDIGYDTIHVVVEYLPIVDILGPPFAVGEDINQTLITCTVTDGIPDPKSITLFHVNETVNKVDSTESQNGVTRHTFDLGVSQRWHSGRYYCEANTTFADKSTESGISEEISIIVHYKPSISGEDQKTIRVTKGSPASLICTVDAYPDADITWTKNGASFDEAKDSGTYEIDSVDEEDKGEYVCNAKNYLGDDSRTIILEIIASQGRTDIPLIAGISAGIVLLLIVIIVLAVMIKRQKKPDKKKTEASEMSPLHFQQTPQAFEIHENPDVANNDTGVTGEKRKSNMYTDAPMSTFKTESDQNNVGGQGGWSNDLDDIAVLYAQPNRKSLHQTADSGNRNHVAFDAEPGEYDPPQEPPRRYKEDNNVEGLNYADLDHAPGSGVTAPKKQPEGTTDYATVDFSRTAPQ